MRIFTRNSVYSIKACGDHFEVTKQAALNYSPYHTVGDVVKCTEFSITLGHTARFYGGEHEPWHTSTVMRVEE